MLAWTIFFAGTGAVVLYASLTGDYPEDSKLGGIIVGATFLVMGVPTLLFMLWRVVDDWRDPPPDPRFTSSAPQATAGGTPSATVPTSWPLAGGGSPPPSPAPAPAEASGDEELAELEKLERLQRLREAGALTDAEFEQQKRRILGG